MHQRVNRQVRLKSRPSGIPQAEHFEIVEAPVPDPSDGQVLVRNIYLSVDPAMRGWVSAVANYSEPVALGAVMRSLAVGRVEESRNSDFHPGEHVTGMFGWQDYAVVDAEAIERKVDGSGLPHLHIAWRPRPQWSDGLFRPAGDRPAQGGRDRGRIDCSGSGRVMRRSNRQDQGVPYRRHCRRARQGALCREEFRFDAAVDYRADEFESALDAACPEASIYAVGVSTFPLVGLLRESIGAVVLPRINELESRNERRQILALVAAAARKLALIYLPVYALLMVTGRDLIELLFTSQYQWTAGRSLPSP